VSGVRRHLLVSGVVQGVGFRFFVVREAESLGLTGWVRNLPGGEVDLEAQGDEERVNLLEQRVRRGPSAARVTDVQSTTRPLREGEAGFDIRY
jgi:acylphosphatase